MTKHFINEIEKLKKKILHLAAMVEDNLLKSVKSVYEHNINLADEVILFDREVDEYEVVVEEECLKILALHQPVAADLRYVIAVLKINNDFERIGDLAVNIAKRSKKLQKINNIEATFDLSGMLERTLKLVQKATDALINNDVELAQQVILGDDEIDDRHKNTFKIVQKKIKENPDQIEFYMNLISVSRNLERIADHATNIAEDVIYNVEGEIVRHKGGDL